MEFLVLWLVTTIASFSIELANELRMYKDVVDAGYKVDVKRLSELEKQLNLNATKTTLLSLIIPIFNMMQVFQRITQYNKVRPVIVDKLRLINALEEMSEIEKAEYLKNPTILNALVVHLKSNIRLSKAASIKISDGNDYSMIYYEIGESFDITILKVSGSASRLTVEEQKKKIIKAWKNAFAEMTKYGNTKTLTDTLKISTSINLNDSKQDKKDKEITSPTPQKLRTSNQKQALENFRRELLEEKEVIQSTQINKSPILSKKIK